MTGVPDLSQAAAPTDSSAGTVTLGEPVGDPRKKIGHGTRSIGATKNCGRLGVAIERLVSRAGSQTGSAWTAGVTMADSCFASVSNFAVGVAVARIAGPTGLGAFSFAYAAWILLTNLHRSAITDPMAIVGDIRDKDVRRHLARGFAAEVVLGTGATIAFVIIGALLTVVHLSTFGIAILSLAPWVTFLNLQDYWRWIGFMQGRPTKSLINDAVFDVGQAIALTLVVLTRHHSVFSVVSAWGVGAAAGAVYGLRQFGVRPSLRGGVHRLRSRWNLSKWLTASSLTNWGSSQLSLIIPGMILGPASLGGLKAAWGLVTGPSGPIIQAGASFGLPEASKGLAERGWSGLRNVSRFVTVVSFVTIGVIGTAVMLYGGTLLRWFYGPEFSRYEGVARVLAAATMVGALTLGSLLVLKAARLTRALFVVQAAALIVSLPAAVVLASWYGVDGAAWASMATIGTILITVLLMRYRAQRSAERGGVAADPATTQSGAAAYLAK